MRNGFVWDDTALVLRDPLIRSWRLIPEGFRHFLFLDATASDFYRPLQRLTYTWDYAWFGISAPWGWHLTNILLHAATVVLLFIFLRRLARWLEAPGGSFPAAVAAGVWAIHPVHTSAVCYVAGRADLLAAGFGFAALSLALSEKRPAHFGATLCFLAAILSKESGAMALAVWLALLLLRRRQARPLAGWLAVAAITLSAYAALRFSAAHEPAPRFTQAPSLAARPIVAARAWAEYAGLLVAPVRLHMERDVLPFGRGHGENAASARGAQWREFQTLLGAALIVAFAVWMRWARRREPMAFACGLALVIAWLPVSNLLPLNATVAEHWLYVPSAFLFAAAVWTVRRVAGEAKKTEAARIWRIVAAGTFAVWMAFLAARTILRNFDWRDPRTFLERTIANGGDSARMLMNLAALESEAGRDRAAISLLEEARKRAPDHPMALLGLSAAHVRLREFDQARTYLERAGRHPAVRADALQIAAVLDYLERGADRVDLLREAAQIPPARWAAWQRYLVHLAERGELPRAIHELRELVRRQPWRAASWRMLGDLWLRASQTESARRAFRRAAELDVRDVYSREKLRSLPPAEA